MRKKPLCLALAALLAFAQGAALAAKSITSQDLGRGSSYKGLGSNTAALDHFAIAQVPPTPFSQELLQVLASFVADGTPVMRYFSEAIQEGTALLLPPGVGLNALQMMELVPLAQSGYRPGLGAVDWSVETTGVFTPGQILVGLQGVAGDPDVAWFPVKVEVAEVQAAPGQAAQVQAAQVQAAPGQAAPGQVLVHFTEPLLYMLAQDNVGGAVLAILCAVEPGK